MNLSITDIFIVVIERERKREREELIPPDLKEYPAVRQKLVRTQNRNRDDDTILSLAVVLSLNMRILVS